MYVFEVIFCSHLIYKSYSFVRKKKMYAYNDKTLGSRHKNFLLYALIYPFQIDNIFHSTEICLRSISNMSTKRASIF